MAAARAPRAFTTTAPAFLNVLVNQCHVSAAWDLAKGEVPLSTEQFHAIWDTGATQSGITKNVAERCQLTPSGKANLHTARGTEVVNTYIISIGLPNRVVFPSLLANEVELLPPFDVIIGMDVIARGDFAVTNASGHTQFTFRTPPRKHINFVAEINRRGRPLGPPHSD